MNGQRLGPNENRGRDPIDIGFVRRDMILKIIDRGWCRMIGESDVNPGMGEVEATEYLRSRMRKALNELPSRLRRSVTILPGTETRTTASSTKGYGITDIPILFQDIREKYGMHDPHAIIECKRIAGNDRNLCRK